MNQKRKNQLDIEMLRLMEMTDNAPEPTGPDCEPDQK